MRIILLPRLNLFGRDLQRIKLALDLHTSRRLKGLGIRTGLRNLKFRDRSTRFTPYSTCQTRLSLLANTHNHSHIINTSISHPPLFKRVKIPFAVVSQRCVCHGPDGLRRLLVFQLSLPYMHIAHCTQSLGIRWLALVNHSMSMKGLSSKKNFSLL